MNASTDVMHTLAWSLLHFLWQGAAIAALAAAAMYVFRKPATRYLIGVSALAFMLLSFVVTFSLLSGSAATESTWTASGASAAVPVSPHETTATANLPWKTEQAAIASPVDFVWVARVWLIGVFVLALRIAFGLFVIEQLRRRNLVALPDALVERLQTLQARLGIQRGIRYAQCHLVSVPAVIGFFRPVVLVPLRALTGLSPEQLDALIAHELGHIKRYDVVVNFFQVVLETLFFFHPAVWWLNKRIRADREDCCDDIAVSAAGSSVGYAKALATIAHWRDVPHFAMAATGGPVAARVARLLGMRETTRNAGVFTASLVLAGALVAGAVSLGIARVAEAQGVEVAVNAPVKTSTPVVAKPAVAAKPAAAAKPAVAAKPARVPQPAAVAEPAPRSVPSPPSAPNAPAAPPRVSDEPGVANDHSFLEELKSAGYQDLTVDEVIALKVHGVDEKFVREVRKAGLSDSPDHLVAFAVHGVTPAYVQEIRSMGFHADADEIIAFKVHEITPEYVKVIRDLGIQFGTDEIIALKTHGVTSDYVKQMRAAGFKMDTDEIIAMKVHDVTPAYRKLLEDAGFKLDTDQVIEAKVMDITPEFIAKVRSHGFKDLELDQLIALKHADVL
jgi:beta-lactamase regulating signal transducer with metallopeptidase domain